MWKKIFKKSVSHKGKANEKDGRVDGLQSALPNAVQNGKLDLIQKLIGRGAEVNYGGNDDFTLLHLAAQNGHLDVTKFLISQGAEVNKGMNDGWTALHLAAQNGHLDVTQFLISQCADLTKTNKNGWTALHSAAYNGHLEVFTELISQGADIKKTVGDGLTPLHLAAQNGHLDVTRYLISQGADVDKVNDNGWSALYIAAAAGHVRVSSALLSQQAELVKANIIHWTEFHSAAERGDLDDVKDQVSQGAELDKAGSFGWTALHIAASNGHLDMTKYLLSQGADVNCSNDFGRCALHIAARKGNLDVVEYLISKGADMNKQNDYGMTALHIASAKGHLDIVQSLIGHGVEADVGNAFGTTALHFALCNRRVNITKYLISKGSVLNKRSVRNCFILQFDGQYGHYDVVRCMQINVCRANSRLVDSLTLFRGAPESDLGRSKYQDGDEDKTAQGGMVIVHMPYLSSDLDIQGRLVICRKGITVTLTSLQYAIEGGCLPLVLYLISQGVDVNESNNVGWTALHFAAQMGHLDIVDYLLGHGAEVAEGDVDDISPLHVAAFVGHCDVTEHLLRRGAEVNGATKQKGSTALHVGVQNGHLDITQCLLNHGAKIDATDNDGWTPLHIAAQNGHIDVMKCLLQQLADVSKVTKKGSSALHLSAANGHTEVTGYLLEHGAEVNLIKPGQTALQLAAEQDQVHGTSPDTWCAEGKKHTSSPNGHADTEGLRADEKMVVGQHAEKGCTAVHLSTQDGYTSIIETLISHGADLNIQSIDGQTCLHEAIRLSGREDSKVEATPALQQISEQFYQNELPPKKALVFYLLDNGAKPNIKDNQGNLPVHYAKDEIIRQMIFSRSPAVDIIRACRADESAPLVVNAVSAQVGCGGKELNLEHFGISMSIPPGAVEHNESCNITLTLMRDLTSVDIQDDTSVAAYGIRCDPPNMVFHQPVKIRIPHSTLVTHPEQVIPDIVSHVRDARKGLPSVSRTKSSAAPDKLPKCKVLERHLELYIDHCAEWWVLIPLEQQIIQLQFMCTPYVPDKIERGKEFDVHLHLNADIPGIEMEVQQEEKQMLYHKAHRSFPISIEAKSGDISVTCDVEGKMSNTKLLSLKDINSQMRHNLILLSMTPGEEDAEFSVIYVTILQIGRLGRSQSLAFVIRYTDDSTCQVSTEPSSFIRAVEELSGSDLPDIDVISIAEMMTVNQFYDLGVALGFTIQQLDVIEYRRFRDRQQAIYDMLVTWRKGQASGQEAKETFVSLMKSLDSQPDETEISATTGEVPDKILLALASRIKAEQFFVIGKKLGFNLTELEHIQHRTCANRKDANIQMLSSWKAYQRSGPEAIETLKRVWESIQTASTPEKSEVVDGGSSPEKKPTMRRLLPSKRTDVDYVEIIRTTDSDQDNYVDDISKSGGPPTSEELCSVGRAVKSLPLAWKLGKALCLEDDVIAAFIEPPDLTALTKVARQLVDDSWIGLDGKERSKKMVELLLEYNIQDNQTDDSLEELYKRMGSVSDLLQLAPRLHFGASDIMHAMCKTVTLPPYVVHPVVMHMLREWLRRGGTRGRLLEIVQAFRFNDAVESIAATIKVDPGFVEFLSSSILDHREGVVELRELDIRISIPAGALRRGMRSVVTIRVPREGAARIPLRDGEVLITPVVECSLTQELLEPATVVLPHCVGPKQCRDGSGMFLYTKTRLGTFSRRRLLPHSSKGFHVSKDTVVFPTNHLQLFALSSTNVQGVQFRCVTFQPLFMPSSRKVTLRVYVTHPYRRPIKDIKRAEEELSEPFSTVTNATKFSVESTTTDLLISFSDGFIQKQKAIAIGKLLAEESSVLSFELEFSPFEDGEKTFNLSIQQGTSTLVEQNLTTSIEVEPDYGVDGTDAQGRQHYASDKLLETLSNVLFTPKDVQGLGYQLGFTHSAVEKYFNRPDLTLNSVPKSGFDEMLRDWRRRVRPGHQVDRLRIAMKDAGLGYAADDFLHGHKPSVKFEEIRRAIQEKI